MTLFQCQQDPNPWSGNTKGGSITVPLTSCLTGCMATDNFCFYLQNRLIQTSQTGGLQYSDIFPFSIPCLGIRIIGSVLNRCATTLLS